MTRLVHRAAFSLIELMVVLLLMSLLALAVMFSLRPQVVNARLEALADSVASLDRSVRFHSRQQRRAGNLEFDLDEGYMATSLSGGRRATRRSGAAVAAIRTPTRTIEEGHVRLAYDAWGQGDTYAVLLTSGKRREWLVILGMTGQIQRFSDPADVERIFALQQSPNRVNAR